MFTYKGVNIFYERYGTGDQPVLLLHGWGGNGKIMSNLRRILVSHGKTVIVPDLMGFGQSGLPQIDMDLSDYVYSIVGLLAFLGIDKCDVIGHSFGGRIAILLAEKGYVNRLTLISAAGMKPRFSLKKRLKILAYKRAKRKGLDVSSFGSQDYRALPKEMRPIFVRIVNEHLEKRLKNVKCPTLIMWGDRDEQTPIYMAKRLRRGIKNSAIVTLHGGHFAYAEDDFRARKVLEAFLCNN